MSPLSRGLRIGRAHAARLVLVVVGLVIAACSNQPGATGGPGY
jgi:hypothetical protein